LYPFLLEWHMHGELYRLPSYGVMLALGFSLAYFEAIRRSLIVKDDPNHVENIFLVVVLCSVIGARLFHVFVEEPTYYWQHPEKIIAIWEGGYVFYGALLLASAGIIVYCRKQKISFLPYGDIAAPATALGLFIGRIGCFLAGCCWGKPTTLPWGVVFNHPETFSSIKGVPVHPTQLYEAAGGLGIYAYLNWLFKRRRYQGQVFFHAIAVYSVMRFFIECFRGDDVRGLLLGGWVSTSQLVSLALLPAAIVGMRYASRRSSQT